MVTTHHTTDQVVQADDGSTKVALAATRVHLKTVGAKNAVDGAVIQAVERFTERRDELHARLDARREGMDDESGLESIEVVVLSVVGLAIAVGLGAAIRALVENYMPSIESPPSVDTGPLGS